MSQVAALRRARERRAAMTEQQKAEQRAKALANYYKKKAEGKHQTAIPFTGLGGYGSYTLDEVN